MRSGPGLHRNRVVMLLGAFVLAFALIAGRLVQIQALGISGVGAYWRGEVTRSVAVPVLRGSILSRTGRLLAASIAGSEVVADDLQVNDVNHEAAELAPLLGVTPSRLESELSGRSGFVVLAPFVDPVVARRVAALDAAGITEEPASQRVYPNGTLAADVIGNVHADGSGASGLEYEYNAALAGHAGKEVLLVGPDGQELPGGVLVDDPARPGTDLKLTLSRYIQYRTEQALAAEMVASHSRWGSAVILDSRSGDILAMVNLQAGPTPTSTPVVAGSNLAVSRVFEPGSVMKLATFSGALTRGLVTPDTVVRVPDRLSIDGSLFHDAEVHPTENLTATQVLAESSNVGTIKIAEKLGKDGLYQYLNAFGFGRPVGLGFPGTSWGIVNPPDRWSGTALGSTAIGQDESVSVLQLADAYNTLANGGLFVTPRLVQSLTGPDGKDHAVAAPRPRRVVPAEVAAEMTSMLEQVVSNQGTAPGAALPAWSVAGKTGTAQIPRRAHPGYQPGAFMAVFAGFSPAVHPAITAVVALDRPTPIYGGSVAAPVFAQIATDALAYLHVPPSPGRLARPVTFSTGPGFAPGLPGA